MSPKRCYIRVPTKLNFVFTPVLVTRGKPSVAVARNNPICSVRVHNQIRCPSLQAGPLYSYACSLLLLENQNRLMFSGSVGDLYFRLLCCQSYKVSTILGGHASCHIQSTVKAILASGCLVYNR